MTKIRTRFAPSPTGRMHVGNLRTALYAYLITKHEGGDFILRIEDTDQERFVEGAVEIIYQTLKDTGLVHDEGPDIGGDFGPYVQSERKDMYLPYAEQLIKEGKAYRCFCTKERLEKLQDSVGGGYDRHCRNLPQEEIDRLLAEVANLRQVVFRPFGEIANGVNICTFQAIRSADRQVKNFDLDFALYFAFLRRNVCVFTWKRFCCYDTTFAFLRYKVCVSI